MTPVLEASQSLAWTSTMPLCVLVSSIPTVTFANSFCVLFKCSCCSCKCALTSSIFSMDRFESDTNASKSDSICFADSLDWSAREEISLATTANPLPASPALAASIEAFKDNRFVCWAIEVIKLTAVVISPTDLSVASTFCATISIASTVLLLDSSSI